MKCMNDTTQIRQALLLDFNFGAKGPLRISFAPALNTESADNFKGTNFEVIPYIGSCCRGDTCRRL
jgi:hypothetical protein